jgi:GxxExxY protein
MHKNYKRADGWTSKVIASAIEVHRLKGPGLLEPIYEKFLMCELALNNVPAVQQIQVPIEYKGTFFEETLRLDVLVDDCLLVELKAVENVAPIHKAQLLSYMKLMDIPIGLLINFNELTMKDGIRRLTLKSADKNMRSDSHMPFRAFGK